MVLVFSGRVTATTNIKRIIAIVTSLGKVLSSLGSAVQEILSLAIATPDSYNEAYCKEILARYLSARRN